MFGSIEYEKYRDEGGLDDLEDNDFVVGDPFFCSDEELGRGDWRTVDSIRADSQKKLTQKVFYKKVGDDIRDLSRRPYWLPPDMEPGYSFADIKKRVRKNANLLKENLLFPHEFSTTDFTICARVLGKVWELCEPPVNRDVLESGHGPYSRYMADLGHKKTAYQSPRKPGSWKSRREEKERERSRNSCTFSFYDFLSIVQSASKFVKTYSKSFIQHEFPLKCRFMSVERVRLQRDILTTTSSASPAKPLENY